MRRLTNDLPDVLYSEFKLKHSPSSVPVSTQYEMETIQSNYQNLKPVIVDENTYNIISKSSSYKNLLTISENDVKTPYDLLLEWINKYESRLDEECVKDFDEILKLSTNWR